MQRRKVDLPQPLGPMMNCASPRFTVSETPVTAATLPYDFFRSRISTRGGSPSRRSGESAASDIIAPLQTPWRAAAMDRG